MMPPRPGTAATASTLVSAGASGDSAPLTIVLSPPQAPLPRASARSGSPARSAGGLRTASTPSASRQQAQVAARELELAASGIMGSGPATAPAGSYSAQYSTVGGFSFLDHHEPTAAAVHPVG